jgi:hypothetical protein
VPLVVALFFAAAAAGLAALYVPARQAAQELAAADAAATSLLAYREAVIDYLNAHPSFSGTVADASLVYPWGYARDARWSHLVLAGGALYVYQASGSAAASAQLLERLHARTQRSWMVGRQSAGQLVSAGGVATGIAVPVAVPDGAVLFVGK